MMVNTLMLDLQTNLRALAKYNQQIESTKRINKPSDDPGGIVKSLRLRTNLNEVEQYSENISDGVNFMRTTDSALDNVDQILQRIRELVVDVANEVKAPEDMQMTGQEISELRKQMEMISNTTYGTKMVFAGRNVTESPYQNGKWTGNNELLYMEIGVANVTPINITNKDMNNFFTGDKVNWESGDFTFPLSGPYTLTVNFTNPNGTPGTTTLTVNPPASATDFADIKELNEAVGLALYNDTTLQGADLVVESRVQDGHLIISSDSERLGTLSDSVNGAFATAEPFSVFKMIDKIVADIAAGRGEACSRDLDLIDSKLDDLLASRATLGARINRLELQLTRLDDNRVSYTDLLSQNEDTDMGEAILKLKTQENTYRAALEVGARIIQPTLVDFLN
jgi:flagellar hook-associated protein 3 FlgL